jgi:hypothetical protein
MAADPKASPGGRGRLRVRFSLPSAASDDEGPPRDAEMAHPRPRRMSPGAGGGPFAILGPPYFPAAAKFIDRALGAKGYYAKLIRDEVRAAPDVNQAALVPFRHHFFAPPLAQRWGAVLQAEAPSFDADAFGRAVLEEFGGPFPGGGAGGEESSSSTDDPPPPGEEPSSGEEEEREPAAPPLRPVARRW